VSEAAIFIVVKATRPEATTGSIIAILGSIDRKAHSIGQDKGDHALMVSYSLGILWAVAGCFDECAGNWFTFGIGNLEEDILVNWYQGSCMDNRDRNED
jgi:hypothetical protein